MPKVSFMLAGCRGLSDARSEGHAIAHPRGLHSAALHSDHGTRTAGTAVAHSAVVALFAILFMCVPTGCSSGYQADARLLDLVARAEFGRAREVLFVQTPTRGHERTDLLDATKRGMLALADGLPDAADADLAFVFETLRTQGLNDDRTTESILVSEEGTRIWKGEPFEQALAYVTVALADASRGDWGNTRAAAANALFHLREYRATESDDAEYDSVESTFALGYMLHGIAALEMHRREEATDSLAKAVAARPGLAGIRDTLLAGAYDTILVIDYGLGPRREAVGPGGVAVRYVPRTRSDSAAVRVGFGGSSESFPQACDVNEMSRDARWQSRESIRRFKQGLGEGLMVGGLVLASTGGTDEDDDIARLAIGAGLMALGAISQANAKADTRHNELLPQRVYIVPLALGGYEGPVRVEVEGHGGGQMTLHGLHVRGVGERVLRYVRLPVDRVGWADASEVVYRNDATEVGGVPSLPWILGGRDARTPTHDSALDYERAGLDVGGIGDTLGEVEELYRAEGIELFPMDDTRLVTGHIFEGGHSLFTPLPGTTGFSRLFAREHGEYRPASDELGDMIARQSVETQAAATLREDSR